MGFKIFELVGIQIDTRDEGSACKRAKRCFVLHVQFFSLYNFIIASFPPFVLFLPFMRYYS